MSYPLGDPASANRLPLTVTFTEDSPTLMRTRLPLKVSGAASVVSVALVPGPLSTHRYDACGPGTSLTTTTLGGAGLGLALAFLGLAFLGAVAAPAVVTGGAAVVVRGADVT